MKYSFIEWLRLNEDVKEKEFKITIKNIEYTVIRDKHLRQKRNGDNKPKDFKMSKAKYEKLFNNIDKIDTTIPFSFTWTDNNKSNIISAELVGVKIVVFGAIMNSALKETQLYPLVKNRISVTL